MLDVDSPDGNDAFDMHDHAAQLLDPNPASTTSMPPGLDLELAVRNSRTLTGSASGPMMSLFYLHECARLNDIIVTARARLVHLKTLLSHGTRLGVEDALEAGMIYRGQTPPRWEAASWSASSLAGWVTGARARYRQLEDWGSQRSLATFWLGGFLRPNA